MKWKQRSRQIEELRAKYKGKRYRVPFPDLSVQHNVAPCSNVIAATQGRKELPADAKSYPTGNLHKSGIMLVTPDMMKNDLQYLGGKKA